MPDLPKAVGKITKGDYIAILCSDIHLSEKPPIARSAEPAWFKAMARQLDQLKEIQSGLSTMCSRFIPIVCSGDIFHLHSPGPSLVNFALENLPKMYAIPGQHDLPYHRLSEIKRSAYWTLKLAGKLVDITGGMPHRVCDYLYLHGFAWGEELYSHDGYNNDLVVNLAVVHRYIWKTGKSYPNAPEESHISNFKDVFKTYSAVMIGDNHKGFLISKGTPILNCGTFFRRTIDEKDYQPQIGLLHRSGVITQYPLDVSKDKFVSEDQLKTELVDYIGNSKQLLKVIEELGDSRLDFPETLIRFMNESGVSKSVRKEVLLALESKK